MSEIFKFDPKQEYPLTFYPWVIQNYFKTMFHNMVNLQREIEPQDPASAMQAIFEAFSTYILERHKISKDSDGTIPFDKAAKIDEDCNNMSDLLKLELPAAFVLDNNFLFYGQNYISISQDVFDFILSIDIKNVNIAEVVHPFVYATWILPNSISEISDKRLLAGRASIIDDDGKKILDDDESQFIYWGYKEKRGNIVLPSLGAANTEEIDNWMKKSRIIEFLIKACVFVQAFPECLKEGPLINQLHLVSNKKKGRRKKQVLKNKKTSSLQIEIPDEYKTIKSGHYTRPHFRSLSHIKYRRQDKKGNILEVGEIGIVRIIPIKGHFTGGKLHHINEEEL